MGERVVFEALRQKIDYQAGKKLEELELIRLLPGEKILCIQRQHFVVFLLPMLLPLVIIFLLFSIFVLLPNLKFPPLVFLNPAIKIYLLLTALSFLAVWETFVFMRWFYQFYIVTNKCLLHIHFFRIGGYHIDEIFLEKTPIREIDRNPPNPFYDLLEIEDVYVYFQRLERPEPFIFKTPANARIIEDLLEKEIG